MSELACVDPHASRDDSSGAAITIRHPAQTTERLSKGDGEERVRRALEDGVIAHERAPGQDVGWSIADLANDLRVSETHARRIVRRDHNVHLRAGQIPLLRPRIRAAVEAALGLSPCVHRAIEGHVRRVSIIAGRLNELLERALLDNVVDDRERAQLRAEFRALANAARAGAEDASP